jgi:hypothetical protein
MATTISLPTEVSGGPIDFNGSKLFADDGTNTTGQWINTAEDVTLAEFNSLSVPAGATINGIEVVVDGQGNTGNFIPLMKVYNGTSWSNGLPFQGDFGKSNAEYDPGWGSSSNLWGLAWDATTAVAIQIQVDNSTMLPAGTQLYWDYIKVRITYTSGIIPNGKITLSSGLIQLTSGKVTL